MKAGLAGELRSRGIRASSLYGSRSMKAQMRQANTSGAPITLILGEDEMERGVVAFREMATGSQSEVPADEIPLLLARKLAERSE